MTPAEAVQRCLSRYADFAGRAGQAEFWWFLLFVCVVCLVFSILDSALGFEPLWVAPRPPEFEPMFETRPSPLSGIAFLALLCPLLAVGARRLHDRGRDAFWLVALLLPIVGLVIVLGFCALEGEPEENRFGPPPGRQGG
ncbi:MAG: DUF805 domain-containing protein [Pseudomonadota bacterium]